MHSIWRWLIPELDRFSAKEQMQALDKARETDLDIFELLGVAFGLVLVTALSQYALRDQSVASQTMAVLLNLMIAVPLMALAVVPFHVRRLRRGLRRQIEWREQHE